MSRPEIGASRWRFVPLTLASTVGDHVSIVFMGSAKSTNLPGVTWAISTRVLSSDAQAVTNSAGGFEYLTSTSAGAPIRASGLTARVRMAWLILWIVGE